MSKSGSKNRTYLNRRQALLLPATAGAGMALTSCSATSDRAGSASQLAGNCSTPRSAIANTQYGKVRGYIEDDVFTFKGIPYGQDTGGENRWLRAKAPTPWTDEYPALIYGDNCPQRLHDFNAIEQSFIQQWVDGPMSENMLKLNIWTPSLSGSRPVMVYFHGGGFVFGSSYELYSHEGAQMARNHDVVQVSVNHRLNILGFFDLSDAGSDYADSVNVSMLDLVDSLRWVQENIANFGGDPNRVMIYGQSGGGSKVTTLMGMPSAAGLFHRASAQSGGGGNIPTGEQSKEYAKRVLAKLGVGARDIAALQKMDWNILNEASNAVAGEMNPPRLPGAPRGPEPRIGGGPTLDGRIINVKSFHDAAPEISKDIPMLIGSVSEEGNRMNSRPTEDEWRASLTQSYGADKAAALIAAMKEAHPEKSIRTLSYGVNGLNNRNRVTTMSTMKHALNAAPAYAWYFTWQSPMLEDAGAWHTAELAFCFDNAKRCNQGTGNTPEAQALAKKMAGAWATFARTGNPSQPDLTWTPFEPDRCPTMLFDNECGMVDDPEGGVRKILLS